MSKLQGCLPTVDIRLGSALVSSYSGAERGRGYAPEFEASGSALVTPSPPAESLLPGKQVFLAGVVSEMKLIQQVDHSGDDNLTSKFPHFLTQPRRTIRSPQIQCRTS